MRIGVDARELCGRPTGVGRYLSGLLTRWSNDRTAGHHDFVLYAPGAITLPLDAHRFATHRVPGPGGTAWAGVTAWTGSTWWEQVTLPAAASRDHLDAWFSPAYTAPLRLRVPVIVAIHDLSFVAHPEWFRPREGARRRFLCRRSATIARAIVTISEFTRGELVERLGVPSEKIRVIPPGVTRPQAAAQGRAIGPRPYSVLFVGSIFNRRHVIDLIRAFGPIARSRSDVTLDIVGDNRSYPREDLPRLIALEGLEGRAYWHQYVSDGELDELYARARAFAFLSEYEGLGLTPLEALVAGVPPVLLDTAVARESCGDAAIYVPPNNLAATTGALETALFSEETRSRLLRAAPPVLARYDWARAARETLAVLEGSA